MDSWIILLPTIITIVVCLWTKQIYIGMFAGIFCGCIIIAGGNPLSAINMSFDKLIAVLASAWNVKMILFAVMIGGIIKMMQVSGAIRGLINWLEAKARVTTAARAQFLTWLVGVILFFDQYTSEAITATIGKTLARNYGYSNEKVAYIVDSTAAPMCALLPLNSWGAYIVGILATLGVSDALSVMIKALPFNFYCFFALLIVLLVIKKNWNIGAMKTVEEKYQAKIEEYESEETRLGDRTASPALVAIPLIVVIATVIVALIITGGGSFSDGDTSVAVFYSMLTGNAVMILLCIKSGLKAKESIRACLDGCLEMVPIAMLLVFAFCLSSICGELNVGAYIATLTAAHLPAFIIPFLVFVVACLMAFSTGSSWGTFAIMIPIVVPLAEANGVPLHILTATMLSGAIMGDHCSMISDSTVLASVFSNCDNVSHFKTQLPYALLAAFISAILYIIVGLFVA